MLCEGSVLGSCVGGGCQTGRLVPWQGEGRALCQRLWPARSVWACVTQVEVLTADRSSAGHPPKRKQAWPSWVLSAKAGWGVQCGPVPGLPPAELGSVKVKDSCGQ